VCASSLADNKSRAFTLVIRFSKGQHGKVLFGLDNWFGLK